VLLRGHARGGLGEVFVAYDKELHREVALKEIRADRVDDGGSRARFLLEAEITGSLEHPGIVPVYGMGEFGGGRPYYAMRFVQGESLKAALAKFHAAEGPGRDPGERAPALRGLLRRFIDVCNAIAYAHSRGVLHRDIKPANIMLGTYGETLVVDWGLVKAIGRPEGDAGVATGRPLRPAAAGRSTPTVAGAALGTPAFMSPEQASGELDRLGPRSDIYSLGATLYCLLTGRAPLDDNDGDTEERLRRARAGEIAPPRQVKREVPPALEAVCKKAMARLPEDRYESARALADDVEHWLADEPVGAWREPWTTQARRWAKRHRTPMAAAVVALAAGVIGLAALTVVQKRANDRLRDANAATGRALAEAQDARGESRAALTFFQDKVLAAARPKDQEGGLGIDATIRAAMDAAEPGIEKSFADQPAVEASIRHTLGVTYLYLGDLDPATRQHERALALRRRILGPDHPDTLKSMSDLAVVYQAAGRLADALPLFEDVLARRRARLGPDHADSFVAMSDLALAYQQAGRLTAAVPLLEQGLKGQHARLGPDHPDTLQSMNYLALAYDEAGRPADALPLFEETLRRRQAVLGSDHPSTLQSISNLALAYRGLGRAADALSLQEELLKRTRFRLGVDHPHTLTCMNNLANSYQLAGRLADALPLYEEGLARCRVKLGPDHLDTLIALNNLAMAHQNSGRLADALPLFRESLDARRAKMGPDHPATFVAMNNLALAYRQAGRLDEALPLLEGALKGRRARLAPNHPDTLLSMDNLARAYLTGRPAEAEQLARECLAIRERQAPDDWLTFETRSLLGGSLLVRKEFAEAEPLLLRGYEGLKAREARIPAPSRKRLTQARDRIVQLYQEWGKPDRATAWMAGPVLPDLPADVFAPPRRSVTASPPTPGPWGRRPRPSSVPIGRRRVALLGGEGIPDADGEVAGARGQAGAVRAEGDRGDISPMAPQLGDLRPGRDVPQPDRVIGAAGREPGPVRAERQGPDDVRVAAPGGEGLAGRDVP
jgi:tetratricopeptide (TPR) repeat protein/tRNA A-37 threonylcarbamoyl transferase component Bud32